jgi:hypothetical protein
MSRLDDILAQARKRAAEKGLPYAGALTPKEADELLQLDGAARIVDVRTNAELDYVGRIPGATTPLLFVCRSGARSSAAAKAATEAGIAPSFNVLEGFEGDKDAEGHRSRINGWRFHGLPWVQS